MYPGDHFLPCRSLRLGRPPHLFQALLGRLGRSSWKGRPLLPCLHALNSSIDDTIACVCVCFSEYQTRIQEHILPSTSGQHSKLSKVQHYKLCWHFQSQPAIGSVGRLLSPNKEENNEKHSQEGWKRLSSSTGLKRGAQHMYCLHTVRSYLPKR